MKILLVEDDVKLGKATSELLAYEGCTVDWAQDGAEAAAMVKESLSASYDIVLLDWMLPEISGVEICRLLRNKYNFQGGIIFVTAKGEVEDCVRALDRGAVEINRDLHTVYCRGREVHLRKKEFDLFEMLFVNLNNVLPRTAIFEKIWSDKLDTNMESLDSHIYMLRKSLKLLPEIRIKVVKNIGYKMEIEP